jgi:hypothetical protein
MYTYNKVTLRLEVGGRGGRDGWQFKARNQ